MFSPQSKLTSNSESNSYSLGGTIGFNNSDSSQDRLWTDNVASIIGTNSVTINTENNTNIVGGVIANSTNGQIGSNAVDGNNLTINTKTLTYSNLQDHNNSETNAIGINVGLPVGFGGSSPTNLSLVADLKNTTLGLSYAANSSNQTGETKATIGSGTINLNSTITRDNTTGEVTSITGQETLAENDSRIANLNRDVTTNQVDNGTHYEGGYNIDLNISVAVLNRAYELHKDGLLVDEAKKNLTGTGEKLVDLGGKVWASPNTAIGLTIGLTGYVVGKASGKEVKLDIGENAIQFIGVPFGGGALTLGNVENYFGNASPGRIWPKYESNNENWSRGATYDSVILGGHEVDHTYQAEQLGPFFLPVYVYQGIVGAARNGLYTMNPVNQYNPMEQHADDSGNQSLKNLRNEN